MLFWFYFYLLLGAPVPSQAEIESRMSKLREGKHSFYHSNLFLLYLLRLYLFFTFTSSLSLSSSSLFLFVFIFLFISTLSLFLLCLYFLINVVLLLSVYVTFISHSIMHSVIITYITLPLCWLNVCFARTKCEGSFWPWNGRAPCSCSGPRPKQSYAASCTLSSVHLFCHLFILIFPCYDKHKLCNHPVFILVN